MPDPEPRRLDRPIAALLAFVAGAVVLGLGVGSALGVELTTTTWIVGAVALAVGCAAVVAGGSTSR